MPLQTSRGRQTTLGNAPANYRHGVEMEIPEVSQQSLSACSAWLHAGEEDKPIAFTL